MIDDEFVYGIIPDHIGKDERWDRILLKEDGKSHLERAINEINNTRFETGVDVVIVLSSNETVLDVAGDLGVVSNLVPSFFDIETMLKTYFSDPKVYLDSSEDPVVIVFDPYTLEPGEPRSLSAIID